MANGAPANWIEFVNAPDNASELDDLRSSAQGGRRFGNEDWVMIIVKRLGLEIDNEIPWSSEANLKRLPIPFSLFGSIVVALVADSDLVCGKKW